MISLEVSSGYAAVHLYISFICTAKTELSTCRPMRLGVGSSLMVIIVPICMSTVNPNLSTGRQVDNSIVDILDWDHMRRNDGKTLVSKKFWDKYDRKSTFPYRKGMPLYAVRLGTFSTFVSLRPSGFCSPYKCLHGP